MTTEKVKGKIRISNMATTLGELTGSVGDTVKFPLFKALSDSELMEKGDKITTEELSQTSTSKKIMQYGKGVKIYDIEDLTALGNFIDNAQEQQARIFAKVLDNEMVKDIDANVILKKATTQADSILEAELIDAFQLFSDEQDNDEFAGIVVNSKLVPSFYAMDGFVSTSKTYATNGNGKIENGVIGYFRGSIPVVVADTNTYDSTLKECKSYIIKNGALGIMPKRGLNVEESRDASTKSTDVYADMIFACGLIQIDGVAVVRKTIA
jgi:N4-gp56 family major capsid protein